MKAISGQRARIKAGIRQLAVFLVLAAISAAYDARAAGTAAGTPIDNVATVSFDIGGSRESQDSNIVSLFVLERLDVLLTLQSPQVVVAPNQTNTSILFTLTNTGNGTDEFALSIDNVLPGDNFDPIAAVPAIYFDTDSNGVFSLGDLAYVPGSNDPVLGADQSVDILLVNDIPGNVTDGNIGRSQLLAVSTTGNGVAGTTLPGLGDGGIDAVIGASGAAISIAGEYLVADVGVSVTKAVSISDPLGGAQVLTGATLTYSINLAVTTSSTATGSVFSDLVPANSTFVANSIFLNGSNLTDAIDADVGELDTSGAPTVVVRLGDLTLADGVQTIEFQVTID